MPFTQIYPCAVNTQALDRRVQLGQGLGRPCGIARDHAALPTLGARGQGSTFKVPQQPSGAKERSLRYRPDLNKPRTGSACRWGAIRGWICPGQDRRNSPAPPQLPAPLRPTPCLAPGTSSAACLRSPARALGDPSPRAGGHRAGDLRSCAGAEAPRNTRVTFGQAVARARSGRGRAGFPRRLQGLTTLGLLFKFSVFI